MKAMLNLSRRDAQYLALPVSTHGKSPETMTMVEQIIASRWPHADVADFRRQGIIHPWSGMGTMFVFGDLSTFDSDGKGSVSSEMHGKLLPEEVQAKTPRGIIAMVLHDRKSVKPDTTSNPADAVSKLRTCLKHIAAIQPRPASIAFPENMFLLPPDELGRWRTPRFPKVQETIGAVLTKFEKDTGIRVIRSPLIIGDDDPAQARKEAGVIEVDVEGSIMKSLPVIQALPTVRVTPQAARDPTLFQATFQSLGDLLDVGSSPSKSVPPPPCLSTPNNALQGGGGGGGGADAKEQRTPGWGWDDDDSETREEEGEDLTSARVEAQLMLRLWFGDEYGTVFAHGADDEDVLQWARDAMRLFVIPKLTPSSIVELYENTAQDTEWCEMLANSDQGGPLWKRGRSGFDPMDILFELLVACRLRAGTSDLDDALIPWDKIRVVQGRALPRLTASTIWSCVISQMHKDTAGKGDDETPPPFYADEAKKYRAKAASTVKSLLLRKVWGIDTVHKNMQMEWGNTHENLALAVHKIALSRGLLRFNTEEQSRCVLTSIVEGQASSEKKDVEGDEYEFLEDHSADGLNILPGGFGFSYDGFGTWTRKSDGASMLRLVEAKLPTNLYHAGWTEGEHKIFMHRVQKMFMLGGLRACKKDVQVADYVVCQKHGQTIITAVPFNQSEYDFIMSCARKFRDQTLIPLLCAKWQRRLPLKSVDVDDICSSDAEPRDIIDLSE